MNRDWEEIIHHRCPFEGQLRSPFTDPVSPGLYPFKLAKPTSRSEPPSTRSPSQCSFLAKVVVVVVVVVAMVWWRWRWWWWRWCGGGGDGGGGDGYADVFSSRNLFHPILLLIY